MIQTYFLESTNKVQLRTEDYKVIGICERNEWREYDANQRIGYVSPLYKYPDKDQLIIWDDAPVGATRLDGEFMYVKCPDGHTWCVDGKASNCTMPEDKEHKCWVRHGDPKLCNVTVDKNGFTCQAGAGSIQTPNWHGFLRDGKLVE